MTPLRLLSQLESPCRVNWPGLVGQDCRFWYQQANRIHIFANGDRHACFPSARSTSLSASADFAECVVHNCRRRLVFEDIDLLYVDWRYPFQESRPPSRLCWRLVAFPITHTFVAWCKSQRSCFCEQLDATKARGSSSSGRLPQ